VASIITRFLLLAGLDWQSDLWFRFSADDDEKGKKESLSALSLIVLATKDKMNRRAAT